MLKTIFINNKKVPVPVPVKTLGQALEWIEHTLVRQGHTITRVMLNDKVLGEDLSSSAKLENLPLDANSKLAIQIDSPIELAIQTLEAIRNLSTVILDVLKPLAVACWQARPTERPQSLENVERDIQLVLDLIEHLNGLIDPAHTQTAAIQGIAAMIQRATVSMQLARSNSDWKACARLLLNRFEPSLKDLAAESETLQIYALNQTVTLPNAKMPSG